MLGGADFSGLSRALCDPHACHHSIHAISWRHRTAVCSRGLHRCRSSQAPQAGYTAICGGAPEQVSLHTSNGKASPARPTCEAGYGQITTTIPAMTTAAFRFISSPSELLQLVFNLESSLNSIHLTAAVTRLAALGPSCEDSSEAMQVQRFLLLLRDRVGSLDARGTANMLWALGKIASAAAPDHSLQEQCLLVAAALQPAGVHHMRSFNAQHVPNMLWALAVLGRSSWESSSLDKLLHAAEGHMRLMSPQGMSNALWSTAKLGLVPSESWLSEFFQRTENVLHTWSGQSLAMSMWALATMDKRPPSHWLAAFYAQTTSKLRSFDCQAIANIVWSLGVLYKGLEVSPPRPWLMAACAAAERQVDRMSAQQLSNLLWGISKISSSRSSRSSSQKDRVGKSASGPGVSKRQIASATPSLPSARFLRSAAGCVHGMRSLFTEQGFSSSSLALARMGFVPDDAWLIDWAAAAERHLQSGSSQTVSSCLYTLLAWSNSRPRPKLAVTASVAAAELAQRAAIDANGRDRLALLTAMGTLPAASFSLPGQTVGSNERRPSSGILDQPGPIASAVVIDAPLPTPRVPARSTAAAPNHAHAATSLSMRPAMLLPVPELEASRAVSGAARNGLSASGLSPLRRPSAPPPDAQRPSTSYEGEGHDLNRASVTLCQALSRHLQVHINRYSPCQIATSLWHLARVGAGQLAAAPERQWLESVLVPHMDARSLAELSDRELAMYTWVKHRWGLPVLSHITVPGWITEPANGSREDSLNGQRGPLGGQTAAQLRSLGPQALAAAMRAVGYWPSHFHTNEGRVLQHMVAMLGKGSCELNGRSLSICLWSSARLGYRPGSGWQAQLWHAMHLRQASMSAGEFSLSLWALASMRCRPSSGYANSAMQRMTTLAPSVSDRDACRFLHAASTWKLRLPPQLWQGLQQGALSEQRVSAMGARPLDAVLLHAGRLGLPIGDAWISAAYQRVTALLPSMHPAQMVGILEATAFLQAASPAGQSQGRALFEAILLEYEERGLAQVTSSTEDARLLRCLVMHRRQAAWLTVESLEGFMSIFYIISRSRLAPASTQQLLHLLHWLAHLNVMADEAWLEVCRMELQARLRTMGPNELSWSLLVLLQCGCKPSPEWVGLYMGVVLQRMPNLQPVHVCRVTSALAKLDFRLHAQWQRQLVTSYS